MGVHTRPRRICDGNILNERIGGIGDNTSWTERRRLDGKLESVGAAAVVTEAWLAPRQGRNKLGLFGILGRLVLAISAASIVAFVVMGRFSPLWKADGSGAATSFWSRLVGRTFTAAEPPQRPAPQLVVRQVPSGPDEDLSLGLSVLGETKGAALVITGLPTGSALSSGRPVGTNSWRVSAADLDNIVIRLPKGFADAMDLTVELHLPNETVAETRSIRLERAPAATAGRRMAGTETIEPQTGETLPGQPQAQLVAPLDLLRIEDATRAQQRLIELGFLSGPADGVWGPRSRSALRGFRVVNNLGSDDIWDERTQRDLFTTSVVPGSSTNQPGTNGEVVEATLSPPPGAARNPLNHSDALWIQKRLRDLGYYFGSGDGVWGASSRSALRDFKAINGLQENDTWDKETEERLSSGQNIHPSGIFLGQWGLDIAQCQQFQDSSAPITINSHRAETVGSVCNFRSIKREATNSWRIHAVCSADGNSWNANISLKLVGSKLSWSSERGTATYVRCPRELGTAMTGTRGGTPVHVGSR